MQLDIEKAQGKISNVNLRTENNGDEKVLACDIKLTLDIPAKAVKPLFATSPDFFDSLWDSKGIVVLPEAELVYRVPVENIELQIDELQPIKGARIKKNIRFIPRNGTRFEATLTVQVSGVTDVRPLAKRLHEEVKATIIERQQQLKGLAAVA